MVCGQAACAGSPPRSVLAAALSAANSSSVAVASSLQLFELKLHLLKQPRLALRARAVERAAQLLDLKLVVGDQRGAGIGELGFRFEPRGALGNDHRVRGGKICRERFRGSHAKDRITSVAMRKQKALAD
jgi:hypothetical protein